MSLAEAREGVTPLVGPQLELTAHTKSHLHVHGRGQRGGDVPQFTLPGVDHSGHNVIGVDRTHKLHRQSHSLRNEASCTWEGRVKGCVIRNHYSRCATSLAHYQHMETICLGRPQCIV